MNLKFTIKQILSVTMMAAFGLLALSTTAQSNDCENAGVLWLETFGQGTGLSSHPNVFNLVYDDSGNDMEAEGRYRVANSTQQMTMWHASGDHTGDEDGRMLVINGESVSFFQHTVNRNAGFAPGIYRLSLFAINVNTPGTCGPDALLAELELTVEYKDAADVWVPLMNSPYTAGKIPQSATPTWVEIGSNFYLPDFSEFQPTNVRITIGNKTSGGCGNDFAIDDIQLALCPEGGPVPVTFTTVTAQLKGSGVSIDWGTAQEVNNDRFEVQRSANGSDDWKTISVVSGAGFSQTPLSYNAFDANPLSGVNYYRINQIDKDGRSAFSKTVAVRTQSVTAKVSVVGNPFRNNFTVKFSGAADQIHARLVDITGKQVASETWNVPNGESSKQFNNISSLQNGIYILTLQSKSGDLLFNGKVLKQ